MLLHITGMGAIFLTPVSTMIAILLDLVGFLLIHNIMPQVLVTASMRRNTRKELNQYASLRPSALTELITYHRLGSNYMIPTTISLDLTGHLILPKILVTSHCFCEPQSLKIMLHFFVPCLHGSTSSTGPCHS